MSKEKEQQLEEVFKEEVVSAADSQLIEEMAQSALMYGHKRTRTNPKFKPFVFGNRNNIEIIDLALTVKKLHEAIEFLKTKWAKLLPIFWTMKSQMCDCF